MRLVTLSSRGLMSFYIGTKKQVLAPNYRGFSRKVLKRIIRTLQNLVRFVDRLKSDLVNNGKYRRSVYNYMLSIVSLPLD